MQFFSINSVQIRSWS